MKKILSIIVMVVMITQANAQSASAMHCPQGMHYEGTTCVPDVLPASANKTERWGDRWGIVSVEVGYLLSANKTNTKTNKPLFAGNGVNAGIAYRWGDRWGIAGKTAYTGGKTDEASMQAFAKTLVSSQNTYKINGGKRNWSQINVAVGPSVMLGKKHYRGEINAIGGVGFGKKNTLTIDKYDAQTKVGTVYTGKQKSVVPFWEVGAKYLVAKVGKNLGMSLKGSYGSNGGTIGVSFAIYSCWACQCCKFCPFGCPPPKGSK